MIKKMKKCFIGVFSFLILNSCQIGPSQKEYNELKYSLEKCIKENEELKNTPENRLFLAQKLETDGAFSLAENEYTELLKKYPKSKEAKIAQEFILRVEKERKEKKIEEERKKRLGFKVLNQMTSIEQGDCKLKFSNIKLSNQWIFDRYGDEWRYIESERGNKYLTFTLSITSSNKSPKLPPLYVYQLIDGKLQYKSTANYKFYRWDDYGSYLGNDADYNNDFSRTATIRFSPATEINMAEYNKYPTFLMVKKSNCVYRKEKSYGRPPVLYSSLDCKPDKELSVDKAISDFFTIKIFNKNKI